MCHIILKIWWVKGGGEMKIVFKSLKYYNISFIWFNFIKNQFKFIKF